MPPAVSCCHSNSAAHADDCPELAHAMTAASICVFITVPVCSSAVGPYAAPLCTHQTYMPPAETCRQGRALLRPSQTSCPPSGCGTCCQKCPCSWTPQFHWLRQAWHKTRPSPGSWWRHSQLSACCPPPKPLHCPFLACPCGLLALSRYAAPAWDMGIVILIMCGPREWVAARACGQGVHSHGSNIQAQGHVFAH